MPTSTNAVENVRFDRFLLQISHLEINERHRARCDKRIYTCRSDLVQSTDDQTSDVFLLVLKWKESFVRYFLAVRNVHEFEIRLGSESLHHFIVYCVSAPRKLNKLDRLALFEEKQQSRYIQIWTAADVENSQLTRKFEYFSKDWIWNSSHSAQRKFLQVGS
jgi:hypothetical protein